MVIRILAFLWVCLVAIAGRRQRASLLVAVVGLATLTGEAEADCAGAPVGEVRSAYDEAQAFERAGEPARALAAYVRAQEYTCEANPVERDAAKRAAAIALPLAQGAEKSGQLDRAFEHYEAGGHFASADRVLISLVRSRAHDVGVYDRAVSHFAHRALPAFAANHATQLSITGAYAPDAAMIARLEALPAKRAGEALAGEAKKFVDDYLRAVIDLERTRPSSPADFGAMPAAAIARQQFATRWPGDPLAESRELLRIARQWASRDPDTSRARGIKTRIALRYADRANTLVRNYSAAPHLLHAAMDYYRDSASEAAHVESDLAQVRAVARQLGNQSARAERYLAAAEYYDVAGDEDEADAARQRQSAVTQAQLAPAIAAAQRQALEMARAFGTPEQVEALERQLGEPVTTDGPDSPRGTSM